MGAFPDAKGESMQRNAQRATAILAAATALGAAAAALAPSAGSGDARSMLDLLVVMRDGHGAVPLAQPDDLSRRAR